MVFLDAFYEVAAKAFDCVTLMTVIASIPVYFCFYFHTELRTRFLRLFLVQ